MTNEKIYSTLCDMLRLFGDRDGNADFAEAVIKNPHKYASFKSPFPFYGEAAALLVDCMESMDKKTTKAGQLAAIKRFLSADDARPIYTRACLRDGKLILCDGYKLLILDKDLESLPHNSEADNANYMDAEKAIAASRAYSKENGVTIPAPSVGELKAFISANGGKRGEKPYIWNDVVGVNPQYLLDAIQAAPGAVFYKPEKPSAPIYFCFDGGEGMILPVRVRADSEAFDRIEANYSGERKASAEKEHREIVAYMRRTVEKEFSIDSCKAEASRAVDMYERGEIKRSEIVYSVFREQQDIQERIIKEQHEQEAAEKRVAAVAAAVRVNGADDNILSLFQRAHKRGDITEDEAKHGILFPVSCVCRYALALPAHVEEAAPAVIAVPIVKNLSQFKKAISAGHAFKIVKHYYKPELSGQIRKPSIVQTNAFYSIVPGNPENPVSKANVGKGYYLQYGKAGDWDFTGDTIKLFDSCRDIVWEITFDLSYKEPSDVPAVVEQEAEQKQETPAAVSSAVAVSPALLHRFEQEYSRIYDARDNVPYYREAVAAFDSGVNNPTFCASVNAFCKERGDFISSDREAAAYVFAVCGLSADLRAILERFGFLPNFKNSS